MTSFDAVYAPCRPVDTTRLDGLMATWGDMPPIPPAMEDDTLGTCSLCHCDIWVGPRKRFMASLGQCVLICYACLGDVMRAQPRAEWHMGNLNPDRVERPRTD